MQIYVNRVINRDAQPKITQCMHLVDSLTQDLQTLNTEQNQTVDNSTHKIVDYRHHRPHCNSQVMVNILIQK